MPYAGPLSRMLARGLLLLLVKCLFLSKAYSRIMAFPNVTVKRVLEMHSAGHNVCA